MSEYSFWYEPKILPTDAPTAIEIDHHSGPRVIAIEEGRTFKQTVYDYIRATHHFLKDGDHLIGNEDDPFQVSILHSEKTAARSNANPWRPSWDFDAYEGSVWFSVSFRIISPHVFERDIAKAMELAEEYSKKAEECDQSTVKGLKRYDEHIKSHSSAQRRASWYARRRDDLVNGEGFFDYRAYHANFVEKARKGLNDGGEDALSITRTYKFDAACSCCGKKVSRTFEGFSYDNSLMERSPEEFAFERASEKAEAWKPKAMCQWCSEAGPRGALLAIYANEEIDYQDRSADINTLLDRKNIQAIYGKKKCSCCGETSHKVIRYETTSKGAVVAKNLQAKVAAKT